MDKRSVLRLKPGSKIMYGNHWLTEKITQWKIGEVLRVTDKGGVRVRPTERDRGDDDWQEINAPAEWIPYHYVLRIEEQA